MPTAGRAALLACAVTASNWNVAHAQLTDALLRVTVVNLSSEPMRLLASGLDLDESLAAEFDITSGDALVDEFESPEVWFIYGYGEKRCRFVAQRDTRGAYSHNGATFAQQWSKNADSIGEVKARCEASITKKLSATPHQYSVSFRMY